MFYLHKINLYFIVGVNQCRRKPAFPGKILNGELVYVFLNTVFVSNRIEYSLYMPPFISYFMNFS